MATIQKKVCMLGSFAVGKTSLVRRYVDSIFKENYITTIGVKIDKKVIEHEEHTLSMVLWDVYGEDKHQSVVPAYLRGLSAYVLVVDPTRAGTLKSAISLHALVEETVGSKPFVLALNKSDLKADWEQDMSALDAIRDSAVCTIETSAKTDSGVDDVFESLAHALLSVAAPVGEGRSQ